MNRKQAIAAFRALPKEERLQFLSRQRRIGADVGGPHDSCAGLVDLVLQHIKPDMVIVEVGCFRGASTSVFAEMAAKVYAVDAWDTALMTGYGSLSKIQLEQAEELFNDVLEVYPNIVKVKKLSLDAAKDFENGSLDAVYIDGDHNEEAVKADVAAWLPKLKKDTGLLMGHDYGLTKLALDRSGVVKPTIYPDNSWVLPVRDVRLAQSPDQYRHVDFVISAYKGSLQWLPPYLPQLRYCRIYDKGNQFDDSKVWSLPAEKLPNVGKCDHTYLHHIVEHYDDLADWTVFLPDNPQVGTKLYGCLLEDSLEPGDALRCPRVCRVRDWGVDGRIQWATLDGVPTGGGSGSYQEHQERGAIERCELTFPEWSRRYVGYDPDGPDWPGYCPGSVLAVPRRAITYLPIEFYERLRALLSRGQELEECHYLERLYLVIFSGKAKYLPGKDAPLSTSVRTTVDNPDKDTLSSRMAVEVEG